MMKIVVNYVRPDPYDQLSTRLADKIRQDEVEQTFHVEDRSVRSHEQTHLRLLGPAASGPVMYDTVTGPDGRSYAVGGKIKVDLAPVPGDPEATLRKARLVRLAALGPNDPSSADMRVAAAAYRLESAARRQQASDQPEAEALSGSVDIISADIIAEESRSADAYAAAGAGLGSSGIWA